MNLHGWLPVLGLLLVGGLAGGGCGGGGGSDSGGPETVTVTIVNRDTNQTIIPDWVAFQDGVGSSWKPLSGSGAYSATVTDTSGAYGFVFVVVYEVYDWAQVFLLRGTTADGKALVVPIYQYEAQPEDPWSQVGTVHSLPADIDLLCRGEHDGWGMGILSSTADFGYSFSYPASVDADAGMVLGNRSDVSAAGYLYLRRNMNQPSGTVVNEDIDFSAPYDGSKHTHLCTQGSFTVPEASETRVMLRTVNSLWLPLGGGREGVYVIPPASARLPTDSYRFYASNDSNRTFASATTSDPTAPSLTLPSPFSFAVDQSAGVTLQGLTHPSADLYEFTLDSTSDLSSWEIKVSANWLRAAGGSSCAVPDLSSVEGWLADWSLAGTPLLSNARGSAHDYSGSLERYLLHNASSGGIELTVRTASHFAIGN